MLGVFELYLIPSFQDIQGMLYTDIYLYNIRNIFAFVEKK